MAYGLPYSTANGSLLKGGGAAGTTIGPGVNQPTLATMTGPTTVASAAGRQVVGSAEPGTAAPDPTGAVMRDHRKKWRPDFGKEMTDEEYANALSMYGVDASGTSVNPGDPQAGGPAPGGPAPSVAPPPITFDPTIGGMSDRQAFINGVLGSAAGRTAPQSAGATLGPANLSQDAGDVRGQQMALAQMLQRYAGGQDSAVALQMKQAQEAQAAQQMAIAAGARPGGAQLAGLTAAQNIGAGATALAGPAAIARIQEQRSAQDALGQLLGMTRGQDLSNSQFNAGALNSQNLSAAQLLQQNNQFNTSAGLQQTGLNDALTQGLLGQQLGGMNLQQSGNLSAAQLLAQQRAQELELLNRLQLGQMAQGGGGDFLTGLFGAAKTGLSLYPQLRGGGGGGGNGDGVNGDIGP